MRNKILNIFWHTKIKYRYFFAGDIITIEYVIKHIEAYPLKKRNLPESSAIYAGDIESRIFAINTNSYTSTRRSSCLIHLHFQCKFL